MIHYLEQDILKINQEWVYCLDCGLLIEPWKTGKKKITICNICKQVYTQTSHPWLQKMLALHLSNPKIKKFSIKNTFMCEKCGNYFFRQDKTTAMVCKWCTMLAADKNDKTITRCSICNNVFSKRYNTKRLVCETCIKNLENIQVALKCTHQVLTKIKGKRKKRLKVT